MKTAAVIAEFNPLHNGHDYLLKTIRGISRADHIVVIMSGDFVQRGEPAVFDKYVRAKAALLSGAGLVLELPVKYAAANAGDFAYGAVRLADALGTVDELWFGSESGEIGRFLFLSERLASEPEVFKSHLASGLKDGLSYPRARADALFALCEGQERDDLHSFLAAPNNILGLEYCAALLKTGSRIRPRTLKRCGGAHNAYKSSSDYSSAAALRESIFNKDIERLKSHVPESIFPVYRDYLARYAPIHADDFSLMLKYRLMSCSAKELRGFSGVSKDLSLRIMNSLNDFRSFTLFADLIKTRNVTLSHVKRALLSVLLGIRADDPGKAPRYAHILALGDCGGLPGAIKEKGSIKLCSTPSVIKDGSYDTDLFASNLYETVRSVKSGTPFVHEFSRKLISGQK